jgi:hypothetical protein
MIPNPARFSDPWWEAVYRNGEPEALPGSGWGNVAAADQTRGLARLIRDHTAPYPDAERRAWMEQRLRAWWHARGGGE